MNAHTEHPNSDVRANNHEGDTRPLREKGVTHLELHLASGAWNPKMARWVKALGGTYTHCRGYQTRRYVTVPFNRSGREVVRTLLGLHVGLFMRRVSKVTIIARGMEGEQRVPSWVAVQDAETIDEFERKFLKMWKRADDRKLIGKAL